MKLVKGLIVGSAASLLCIGAAAAADLPVKAKAVEYVRICSAYGVGFWYIPGTDTCMKIGGYLRVDTTFNGGPQGQPPWNGDLGQHNRYADYYSARSRMALTVDTRTASEYGVVRTFMQADFQFTTQGSSTVNPAVVHRIAKYGHCFEPAESAGRRLCRGRVGVHPVRGLHLRQIRLGLFDTLEFLSR